MEEKAIEVKNLTKKFKKVIAVKNASFDVEYGELFAFLGPNGAGKSTTIRILTTLAVPTSGEVHVAGYNVIKDGEKVRKKIGLVADKMILYDRLTAYENVEFFAKLYGLAPAEIKKRANELFEILEISEWRNEYVSKFSTGMKQKINIIRALIPQPDILFLDEPTLGLDPHTTVSLRNFIKHLNKDMGKTIVLTTHDLHEVEMLADTIAIINKGEIVTKDSKNNIKEYFHENLQVEVEFENTEEAKLLTLEPLEIQGTRLTYQVDNLNEFLKEIDNKNIKLKHIKTIEPSLEDIFVKITSN